jgi:hypothetical protein
LNNEGVPYIATRRFETARKLIQLVRDASREPDRALTLPVNSGEANRKAKRGCNCTQPLPTGLFTRFSGAPFQQWNVPDTNLRRINDDSIRSIIFLTCLEIDAQWESPTRSFRSGTLAKTPRAIPETPP